MKRVLIICISLILILSVSFVSASWVGDLFGKITGKVITEPTWSDWFDRDDSSGSGDYETLNELKNENPGKICDSPSKIECQTTTGINYIEARETITYDINTGAVCVNSIQLDRICNYDYKVRFYCGVSEAESVPIKQIEKESAPVESVEESTPSEPINRRDIFLRRTIPSDVQPVSTDLTTPDTFKIPSTEFARGFFGQEVSPEIIEKSKEVEKSTSDLLELNDKYSKTLFIRFAMKKEVSNELEESAIEREKEMLELAEKNPILFLNNVMSKEQRELFPDKIKENIEEEVTLEGVFEREHADFFDEGFSEEKDFLRLPDNSRVRLHFVYPEYASPGSEVEFRGWKLGKNVVVSPFVLSSPTRVDGAETRVEESRNFKIISGPTKQMKRGTETNGAGAGPEVKKVAVILFNFQDDSREFYTPAEVKEMIFTNSDSIKNYYEEVSYDRITFEGALDPAGDVFGYYTIPYYSIPDCEIYEWRDAAKQQAILDGFVESNYDNIIYAFPEISTCPFAGTSAFYGRDSWVKLRWNTPYIVAHELGHNFGAPHAGSLSCVDNQGNSISLSNNCVLTEYGNLFDTMGSAYSLKHFTAENKYLANFLSPTETQEVTQSGVYTISALELSGGGIKRLIIPKEKDNLGNLIKGYIIEYRGRIPGSFDDFNYSDPVIHGVSISLKYQGPIGSIPLLDMVPVTPTIEDSSLTPGSSFSDPSGNGPTIYTVSVNPYVYAEVYIDQILPPCVRAKPSILISPLSQDGYLGETLKYNLEIWNNDNLYCENDLFNIWIDEVFGGEEWQEFPYSDYFSPLTYNIPNGQSINIPISITSKNVGIGSRPFQISSNRGFMGDQLFYYNVIPSSPPEITTLSVPAESITENSATLRGTWNSRGADTETRFQYVIESDYDSDGFTYAMLTPLINRGLGSGDFSVNIPPSNLFLILPCTTYYYRAVGQNSEGTTFGQTRSFITKGPNCPDQDIGFSVR